MCLKSSVNVREEGRKGRDDGERCYDVMILFGTELFSPPLKCPNVVTAIPGNYEDSSL